MNTGLVKYDEARKALAAAVSVDEAKDIADKGSALQAYARQAHDTALENAAAAIRVRAKRRIGELSEALETAQPGPASDTSQAREVISKREVLKAAGLSTSEANRCEQIAKVPEEEFEEYLEKCAKTQRAPSSTEIIKRVTKTVTRADKVETLKAKAAALPDKRYSVIYADPPWHYRNVVSEDRRLENHYPTMPLADICALGVKDLALDDSLLFLWATITELPGALEVMKAWGFDYRSHAVWVKPSIGLGFWFRAQHELLLLGARGNMPTPIEAQRVSSVIEAPVGKHSAKPEIVRERIDAAYGELPRIELFARGCVPGWDVWGFESAA